MVWDHQSSVTKHDWFSYCAQVLWKLETRRNPLISLHPLQQNQQWKSRRLNSQDLLSSSVRASPIGTKKNILRLKVRGRLQISADFLASVGPNFISTENRNQSRCVKRFDENAVFYIIKKLGTNGKSIFLNEVRSPGKFLRTEPRVRSWD